MCGTCLCFHSKCYSAFINEDVERELSRCILFTFLIFRSALLLYKNSNKKIFPKWDLWRSYEGRWLFNLLQPARFPLSFLSFSDGQNMWLRKTDTWDMSFAKASMPTWRVCGKLGALPRVNFPTPSCSTCQHSLRRRNLKMQPKKQFAGKSQPPSNDIQSHTDWLAVDWKTLHFHV